MVRMIKIEIRSAEEHLVIRFTVSGRDIMICSYPGSNGIIYHDCYQITNGIRNLVLLSGISEDIQNEIQYQTEQSVLPEWQLQFII